MVIQANRKMVLTFYCDPILDRPSTGKWVTETKDTSGKVTTVNKNNDRSFNIVIKNPDGSNSTAIEKPDGTNIIKATDSREIMKTTNSDGTWYPLIQSLLTKTLDLEEY